jgi:hypothetical protein
MNVEFAALAVGVFLLVAVLVCDEIRIWNGMRASEARFKKMQEEIKVLRRLLMGLNEYPKTEAPKIDAHNAPVQIGGGDVDVHLTPLNFISTESHTRTHPLQLQRSPYSFSGMSIFLIISTIAAALAYIFVFESSAPEMDIAILSTTPSVDTQPAIPTSPQALPSMSERQGILLAGTQTGVEGEVHAQTLQTTRRSESRPNESDLTRPAPRRMTEEKGSAMPDLRPDDSDVLHLHEDQESTPPTMNLATESTTTAVDTPAVRPAPLPQALLPPTEARGLAARTEPESELSIHRSAEPPLADRIILEESAPQIVPDPFQAVPLPRAYPKPRLRPAKPKLTVASVSTQAPAVSVAKPPVAAAPVTTAPAVGPQPTVGSVSAQPPAAGNWLRKLLDLGYQE